MHYKRRFLGVLVILVLMVGVIFAGKMGIRSIEENIDLTSWFSQKETIYFWYVDENMTSYINSAAVSFSENHEVRVIPILASDSNYLEEINKASLHSEQIPDAYIVSNDSLEKAYLTGLAGKILDEQNLCNSQNFPKTALDAISYKGKQIGYPLYFDTSVLVYNETYLQEWATQQAHKELAATDEELEGTDEGATLDENLVQTRTQEYFLQAIPGTVNDLLNIADAFDLPEGVDGVMKWDVSDIFYNYWIVGNYLIVGGDSGDDDKQIDVNNQQTIDCLNVYKALNQFFFIESDTVTYPSIVEDFIQGKMVFTIGTTDIIEKLRQAKEDGTFQYDYGFVTMPKVSEELESRSLSVTNVVAINEYSEHKDLANEFASYLVEEYAGELFARSGKASANQNKQTPETQVFFQEYAESVSLPKMMEIGNLWLQLETLFAKIWNGADATPLLTELSDQIATQVIVH